MYFRTFAESTDTAGPQVANWFAPGSTMASGENDPIVDENQQVVTSAGLTHIVLSFDKEMYDNATHTGDAVTNPANYLLLQNGVAVAGNIVGRPIRLERGFDSGRLRSERLQRPERLVEQSVGGRIDDRRQRLAPAKISRSATAATPSRPSGWSRPRPNNLWRHQRADRQGRHRPGTHGLRSQRPELHPRFHGRYVEGRDRRHRLILTKRKRLRASRAGRFSPICPPPRVSPGETACWTPAKSRRRPRPTVRTSLSACPPVSRITSGRCSLSNWTEVTPCAPGQLLQCAGGQFNPDYRR